MTDTPVVFFRTRVGPAALTGLNGVTGATAETTTYDRIFSTMKAIQAIMANRNLNDPTKVTATMLAAAFEKGGEKAPTNPQLCGNKRLVLGIADEAFAALKAISESESNDIHAASLSKNLLDSDIVLKMKDYPLEQTFLFHIL
ncbi:unnamed protein product, partial [Laminaria digitata]